MTVSARANAGGELVAESGGTLIRSKDNGTTWAMDAKPLFPFQNFSHLGTGVLYQLVGDVLYLLLGATDPAASGPIALYRASSTDRGVRSAEPRSKAQMVGRLVLNFGTASGLYWGV
jgi:hypothetical protein